MRAIIVDDEPLARKIIREYLEDFPQIKVVAECSTGRQAVKAINQEKADLVFLDIRMPGMDGFEVIEHLTTIPRIIFSTAYGDFAVKAFDVHAVDYLLKPYDRQRFAKAVNRAIARQPKQGEELDRIALFLQQIAGGAARPERIFVRSGKKIAAIQTDDLLLIEAEGDYSRFHTSTTTYLCSLGMNALEEKLDPSRFIRVHRSAIVAKEAMEHLRSDGDGGFTAILRNGKKVRVSRRYAAKVKTLIW
ncbi:MAG: response regulator transcription factor [Ignavibacteria bacterium]|nr:response regulator transcription factor [Ignavibacteria bacterium]